MFHELPIELQDTLVLTRKRHSDGECKGFEAVYREHSLMKATKTKAKRNKKLKITEAAFIEASYLYQQYHHSDRCTRHQKNHSMYSIHSHRKQHSINMSRIKL